MDPINQHYTTIETPKRSHKLLITVVVCVVISILGSVGVFGYYHYQEHTHPNKNAPTVATQTPKTKQPPKTKEFGCQTKDAVKICLRMSSTDPMSTSDSRVIEVAVTNTADTAYTYTSSDTNTDPMLLANGSGLGGDEYVFAGMAFTDATIDPHQTITTPVTVAGSELELGTNALQGVWAKYQTDEVPITSTKTPDSLVAKQFTECQHYTDSMDSDNDDTTADAPTFCRAIFIYLAHNTDHTLTCHEIRDIVYKAKLNATCDNYKGPDPHYIGLTAAGMTFTYMPRELLENYKQKLSEIPEIVSVF